MRARWRSLVALGLLAGVTAGLALAATSGAQRTSTALDRLRAEEDAPDAVVFASQAGEFDPDLDALAAAPEVAEVHPWALSFGRWDVPALRSDAPEDVVFVAGDERYMGPDNGYEPVVLEGRMFDPDAPDEVVLADNAASAFGIEVGDRLPFTFFSMDQFATGGPPAGPRVDLEVVGVVRTSRQVLFVPDGLLVLSPGFLDAYGGQVVAAPNADITLRDVPEAASLLRETVNEVIAPGTPVLDLNGSARRVETTTDVERTALLALAAVLVGIGAVLVGQAVVRSVRVLDRDAPVLRAMGMAPSSMVAAAVASHLPALLVALLATTATAAAASIWLPVGTAAELEIQRGVVLDVPMLLLFLAALTVVFLGTTALAARTSARAEQRSHPRTAGDPLGGLRRQAPVPVALGTLMAFPRRGDRTRATAGPAIIAATIGIVGVVGVLTIDHGLQDALDHPERAGVTWDAAVAPGPEFVEPQDLSPGFVDLVADQPGVEAAAVVDRTLIDVDGTGVPGFTARSRHGELAPEIELVVTEGRAPTGTGELAIGPATAEQLDVHMGDEVAVGADGQQMTVVGEALFPYDVHSGFDEGVLLAEAGFDAVVPPLDPGSGETSGRLLAVRYDEGTDIETATDELRGALGDGAAGVTPVEIPPELANLEGVRTLPVLLAAFLGLLAIGAVTHALAASVRSRRSDYAVLRSLGMTRRETRGVLHSQSTLIALVGLAIGIPLGLMVGRSGWSEVATSVPLAVVLPLAALLTLLVIPAGLLVANAAALWPGRRLQRLHPAEELRADS